MNTAAAWQMLAEVLLLMGAILLTLLFMLWWGTRPPR